MLKYFSIFIALLYASQNILACIPIGSTNPKLIKFNEDSPVCLILNDQYRIPFTVVTDRMTAFKFSGSYKNSNFIRKDLDGNEWSFFSVSAGNKNSAVKMYKRPATTIGVTPYKASVSMVYTAIISVLNGEVTGVTWDDGCSACGYTNAYCAQTTMKLNEEINKSSPNETVKTWEVITDASDGFTRSAALDDPLINKYWKQVIGTNCYTKKDTCEQAEGTVTVTGNTIPGDTPGGCLDKDSCLCDLTVYVVFTGTDVDGRYLKSAGLRLSRFSMFSMSSLYRSAADISTKYVVDQGFA